MNLQYLIAAVLLTAAGFLALDAHDRFVLAEAVDAEAAALEQETARVEREVSVLERVQESMPAKFNADALSDFFARALEAGEVLGAGVRIETRDGQSGQPRFQELRYGLYVAPVAIQAATDLAAAPAVLAMIEEELAALPVSVKSVRARLQTDSVAVRMEVDVYGRQR